MSKRSPGKRTLTFERLETKNVPAALLVALAPLAEEDHQQLEPILKSEAFRATTPSPTSDHWQFSHSTGALLAFVDQHTRGTASESEVCSPPTWDQCRASDDMLRLRDDELRTIVMTANVDLQTIVER